MGAPQAERDAIKDADYRKWANERESEPTLTVIAEGFWLADSPCTQAFWHTVMGDTPSHFKDAPDRAERPVEEVTWDDVEKFVLRFASTPEWGCERRLGLPTEAQWEYAARAGSRTAFWWGEDANSAMANWDGEQRGTTPVKRYPANPWGLFDVHGNVWEWCADLWRQRLDSPEVEPDQGARVVRGGSWGHHPGRARSACRRRGHQGLRHRTLGFRFALRSSSHQGAEPQQGVLRPGGPAGRPAGLLEVVCAMLADLD
ncbi:MAG: formylglycine-generating enzyme family protein [Ideonella sp.]|nr:formylglycine-generating enzyme family protein [Ideonella sp.]